MSPELVLHAITAWIYPALLVLFFFGLTIFFHELGHFLVAKRQGMRIERFSVGFGPKIWGYRKGGVDYRISWFPFGGYVALPQMSPMEAIEGGTESKAEELPPASPKSKTLVALAGPAMNIVFAFVLALIVWSVGAPINLPVVGWVEPDSVGARAGIHMDDRITAVNDKKISTWDQFQLAVALSLEPMVKVTVDRGGQQFSFLLETTVNDKLGIKMLDLNPREHPFARDVFAHSPAQQAGIQAGDQFVSIEGMPIYSSEQVVKLIRSRRDQPTALKMLRDGQTIPVTVVPALDPKDHIVRMGVQLGDKLELQRPGPTPVDQFKEVFVSMGQLVGAIYHSKETGVGVHNIQGPIGILPAWWYEIALGGVRRGLVIAILLNINLAIINLLPIPILDGGHIVFALAEAVHRRPLNARLVHATSLTFAALLISFMVYISVNNFEQWFLPDHAKLRATEPSNELPATGTQAPQP